MAPSTEERPHPTIFDPSTCVDKGLCTVANRLSTQTHRLYYEIHGAKRAERQIVFIMGLNNSSFGWNNQVDYFGKRPGYSVLVFDNRGVGNSETGAQGMYKTTEMARDVIELLDHVGWTDPRSVHVVGVSMGGMIAQELCLLLPDRIASLSLTSTKAGNKIDLPPLKGLYMFLRLFSGTVLSVDSAISLVIFGLFPPSFLSSPDPQSPSLTRRETLHREFTRRHQLVRKQPFFGIFGQLGAVLGHCVSEGRLRDIARYMPKVGIVVGDQDALINPERSKELHAMLPGSELVIIKEGGHALPSQCPNVFNSLVERWVEEGLALCKKQQS